MTADTPVARPARRAAIGFIFVTALLDVISFGIMIPVLPNLVKEFNGGDTAAAALWAGLFSTVWALMSFLASPVLGLLSDRFGRRPVILISVFGLGIDYLFMALAPTLAWLFVGRVIHGVTAASFGAASAYIADITPPEDRARRFGLIGAAWGVGFVLGPAIGGFLGEIDLRLPFWAAAGLALANGLYGLFILPESLPPERRAKRFEWSKANPLGSLRLLSSHADLRGLAVVTTLYHLAHVVLPAIFVLYVGHRYGWSLQMTGLMLALTGVADIIVNAALIGPVVKRIGERNALLFGMACGAAGFLIFALAPTTEIYWIGVPVFALWSFALPNVMALMSRRVGADEQGQLQGANASISGLMGMIGPVLFTGVFAWAAGEGLPLRGGEAVLVAALLTLAGLAVAFLVARPVRSGPQVTETSSVRP